MDNTEFNSIFPVERCEISNQKFNDKEELFLHILDQCWKNSLPKHDTRQSEEKEKIFQALLLRENLLTTGVGKGLAIPHCAIDYLHDSYGYLLFLKKDMIYESIDEQKVFFVCMLLIPQRYYELESRTLTKLCTFFKNQKNIKRIQKIQDVNTMHRFFSQTLSSERRKKWLPNFIR